MVLLLPSALAEQPAQSHYVWMSGLTHLHGVAYDEEDDYFFATDSETYYVYRFDNWSSVSPDSFRIHKHVRHRTFYDTVRHMLKDKKKFQEAIHARRMEDIDDGEEEDDDACAFSDDKAAARKLSRAAAPNGNEI